MQIWVNGIEGATAYLVAPNNSVELWDMQDKVIYLKSADYMGKTTMQILDYTIRDIPNPEDDIADLKSIVADLKKQVESLKKGKKKNESLVSEDESAD